MVSGLVVLASALLLPAFDDLAEARWHRARALEIERWRAETLRLHVAYHGALRAGDERLLVRLAASELSLAPAGQRVLLAPSVGPRNGGDVFGGLEAGYEMPPEPIRPDSYLRRLATDPVARLWLMAAGALSVLYGLLPPARPRPDEPAGPIQADWDRTEPVHFRA